MSDKQKISVLLRKRKKEENQSEKKDSDRERKIIIFRKNSALVIYVKRVNDIFYIIKRLNMPYFYYYGKKLYFNYDKNIDFFWSKKENKILYESEINYLLSYDNFLAFHENHEPKNMKFYSDFCFPYYYFSDDAQEQFVNNLDEEVINQLKHTRHFNDYKIVKFFGPRKNGKSTIVYYYFSMRRYIPLNEMYYIEDINNTKKFDANDLGYINEDNSEESNEQIIDELSDKIFNETEIGIEEEKNNKYFIKKNYDNSFKRIEGLNTNAEIEFLDNINLEDLNIFTNMNEINAELVEDEFKNYKDKIFLKEFYFTRNDTIGFFRSCYLNHTFLQSEKNKDVIKAALQFEFSGLFKSYKVYKFFINKFNDFYKPSNNIIDIGVFIIDFMKKYNSKNRRYFIILDGITKDLIDQLKNLENMVRKEDECFLIELYDNEGINEKFENEIINNNKNKDELIIYCENYCEYNGNLNLSEEEKIFLSNYFDKNLYYYKRYINWKKNNNGKDKEIFLNEIKNETQTELLKGFTCEEEGKIFYKYVYINTNGLSKRISNENIIKKLNLNYFFILKGKEKLKLKTLPFIKDILKNYSSTHLKNIIYEDYFISLEEYIKGGIFEDIIKNEIKEFFYNYVKDKNSFQEININRLVDNEIYTFYDKNTIKKILELKNSFKSIKSKINNEQFIFKNKVTILYCVQNAKHYDLGVLFYDTLFIFQITINKNNNNINELIEYLDIDTNYITNKLELLTNEINIIDKIYVYLVNIDFESLYEKKNDKINKDYILINKNKNKKMKEILNNKNIQIIYYSHNCELYDNENNKILSFPMVNDKNIYFNFKSKAFNYKIELLFKKEKVLNHIKECKNLPKFIKRETINYYSLFYPGLKVPKNSILYFNYPTLNISFFKIENKYYDFYFKKSNINYDTKKLSSNKRIVFIFSYLPSA